LSYFGVGGPVFVAGLAASGRVNRHHFGLYFKLMARWRLRPWCVGGLWVLVRADFPFGGRGGRLRAMSVVLVGYRGSGKTTVGRMLAGRLGWALVDTDELVVEIAGKSISRIFADDGEARFRELESAALQRALSVPNRVISTGGGIVTQEPNRKLLKSLGVPVIYLQADARTLWRRISHDARTAANRPALTALGGGLAEVEHLVGQRDPWYREVASHVIDAMRNTRQITEEILVATRLREGSSP